MDASGIPPATSMRLTRRALLARAAHGLTALTIGGLTASVAACSRLPVTTPPTSPRQLPRPGTTPLTITDYRLAFVDVTVSGRSTRALLDTGGATGIQLSSALVHQVGLHIQETSGQRKRLDGSASQRQFGVLNTFEVAGLRQQDGGFEMVEGDIERIVQQAGTPFDVILGWGFFGNHQCIIDFPAALLELQHASSLVRNEANAPELAASSETLALPFTTTARVPIIDGMIGDRPVRFLVDTGAPFSTLDRDFASRLPAATRRETVTYRGQNVPLDVREVAFGEQRRSIGFMPKDLSALRPTGAQGVLGNTLLMQYRVTFDTERSTITLTR